MWPFKKETRFIPHISSLSALASANLFVVAIRLVQFFFTGVVLGIMAYYIHLELSLKESASSPFCFTLVVAIVSMITQFAYCVWAEHRLLWLWDVCNGIGWLLSFFWLLNFVGSELTCSWKAFNPFGSDRCAQTRSVLVIQIIVAILWFLTGACQLYRVWRRRGERFHEEKVEMVV